MLGLIVAIMAIFLVTILSISVLYNAPLPQDRKEIESNRVISHTVAKQADVKGFIARKQEVIQQKHSISENVKPATPQINNYDFEKLSKALIFIVGGIFSIISLKFFIQFFKYCKTIWKFKKNTKKTKMLVDKLKTVFDNQKDFLLITDSIEYQLKINDLLLNLDDSKHYGLELEVADDYLYTSYNFINKKLINNLK